MSGVNLCSLRLSDMGNTTLGVTAPPYDEIAHKRLFLYGNCLKVNIDNTKIGQHTNISPLKPCLQALSNAVRFLITDLARSKKPVSDDRLCWDCFPCNGQAYI